MSYYKVYFRKHDKIIDLQKTKPIRVDCRCLKTDETKDTEELVTLPLRKYTHHKYTRVDIETNKKWWYPSYMLQDDESNPNKVVYGFTAPDKKGYGTIEVYNVFIEKVG